MEMLIEIDTFFRLENFFFQKLFNPTKMLIPPPAPRPQKKQKKKVSSNSN